MSTLPLDFSEATAQAPRIPRPTAYVVATVHRLDGYDEFRLVPQHEDWTRSDIDGTGFATARIGSLRWRELRALLITGQGVAVAWPPDRASPDNGLRARQLLSPGAAAPHAMPARLGC